MNEEIQKIFEEQVEKLPKEIVGFLSSADWDGDIDEIGSLYNLSKDEIYDLHREATLVLAGLAHPDEFGDNLEQEAGIHGAVRDAIVTAVEQKIFAPVRSALIEFLEKEGALAEEGEGVAVESGNNEITSEEVSPFPLVPNVPRVPRAPDIAPDNLPTGEIEPLIPPIPPKAGEEGAEPAHPFEEKMKRVFTAGQQSMGELTLEPAAPQTPDTARLSHDPYREAIE